jgi:methylaspartate mutase sigma subunit
MKILLTTIPSDSHGWNLVFVQMYMQELGLEVENLGTCVPFDEVVSRCREGGPDLIVVSTVNGHGYLEGCELSRQLAELPDRGRIRLVIGGKLGVDAGQDETYAKSLRRAGYDAVFHGPAALDDFQQYLAGAVDAPRASRHAG